MIWEQQLPERLRHEANVFHEDDDTPWSTDDVPRVYFDDKFRERYPWVIREVGGNSLGHRKGALQSQSRVHLYDPSTDRYLCMLPDDKVTSEAVYFAPNADSDDDKPEDRFRIG